MHFYNLIKNLSKENDIVLFVDMDGVIASYDAGKPLDFKNKRPLKENINKLKQIETLPNVELHILSICKKNHQIDEKNYWLNKHAPFFKLENRNIISKENSENISSSTLKVNFLNTIKTNKQIILLDDDNLILKHVMDEAKHVMVFQDSELID